MALLFTAPGDAPTRLQSTLINSTTLLLSWHAPTVEYAVNIQGYYIQVLDSSTGQMNYTTENNHLLLSNLQPNHRYTFRVAAYTNERGPFTQLTATTLGQHSSIGIILAIKPASGYYELCCFSMASVILVSC